MDLSQAIQSARNTLELTLRERPNDQNLGIAVEICATCRIELSDIPLPDQSNSICQAWNQVISAEVRAHAQPTGLRRGTLFVGVDSERWLRDIVRYKRNEFLTALQAVLGSEVIQKVSYRLAENSARPEFIFHLPPRLYELSEIEHEPCGFGHARKCIWLGLKQAVNETPFGLQFCMEKVPENQPEPQTGYSVEFHLEMLLSDLEKALMPYNAKSVQGETLHSLALALSDRFRRGGRRWWAAFKRAEERNDPLVGELRALANFWYLLAQSCDAIVGPASDEEREIASGLSRLPFNLKQPKLRFQAAEINWNGTKIAIIVVKSHIIAEEDQANIFRSYFMSKFDGAHIVLAAPIGDRVNYFGRTDIAQHLAKMDPKGIPWRDYPPLDE
jgi:hypothetical protein